MKLLASALIAFSILLIGCDMPHDLSAKEFYLQTLNLDHVPAEVSDPSGSGSDAFPAFLSEGYLKYKAKPSYFEMLSKHNNFRVQSQMNQKVHRVQCDGPDMPKDYAYWTEEVINVKAKSCFGGLFFPYLHYMIYDPATLEVRHFITGVRD